MSNATCMYMCDMARYTVFLIFKRLEYFKLLLLQYLISECIKKYAVCVFL